MSYSDHMSCPNVLLRVFLFFNTYGFTWSFTQFSAMQKPMNYDPGEQITIKHKNSVRGVTKDETSTMCLREANLNKKRSRVILAESVDFTLT
jgi:hypothetical protein